MERHAWVVVVGLGLVSAVILGTTICTLGLFLGPVVHAFGATTTTAAESATAFVLLMTFAAPLSGWLIGRQGAALIMMIGAGATVLGYLLAAGSDNLSVYVGAMALAGIGAGASTYVPSTIVIWSWAGNRPGVALGLYLATTALGSTVLPVLVSHVLDVLEWRATLRLIALAIALVALPILPWLARSRPRVPRATGVATQETVPGLTVAAGLRRRDFWLLALVQILTGLSFQQVYVYIIPYLLTAGYTADRAALFFGAANATSMGGFFLFGFLADRIGPRRAFVGGLLVCGLSAPLLLEAGKVSAAGFPVAAFALLWGATSSLSSQLVPLLLAGAVGQRAFAPLLGISFVMYGISMSLGALLTGYLVDRTHAFTVPFLLAGVLMLIGVFPTLGVRATAYETGGRSDAVRDRDAISPVGL